MSSAVIFGGSGFIGIFFAEFLSKSNKFKTIYLFDHESISEKQFLFRNRLIKKYTNIIEIKGDVKEHIVWQPDEPVNLIANFAAIHREPGHEPYEYYQTNIKAAENVCKWAEKVACDRIIFSSSIAPYGSSELVKEEDSIPIPDTPYGCSKLVAEKIHACWQAKDETARQLIIVRPGVVFGPSEGGNVSRLISAVKNRYFVYMGNKTTRKAGIYVKELCRAIIWVLDSEKAKADGFTLFNMTMNPGPSVEEYAQSIMKILGKKYWIPTLPLNFILIISYFLEVFSKPFNISHPFSPIRVKKLVKSNDIVPKYLINSGYKFKYTLDDALADWQKDCPEDWH